MEADPVPTWAAALNGRKFRWFNDCVANAVARLGLSGVIIDRELVLETATIDLLDLAQRLAQLDERSWPALAERYLQLASTPNEAMTDGAQIHASLRIRLAHRDALDAIEGPFVSRPALPGVVAVVALDLPDCVQLARPHHLDTAGLSETAAISMAVSNTRERERPRVEHITVDSDVSSIAIVESPGFFTASWALWLEELDLRSPHGVLVAVPTRHLVLVHPVSDGSALKAAAWMGRAAHDHAVRGPGAISPSLYWCRHGGWRVVPTIWSDGVARIRPPAQLLDVVNQLS